MSEGSRRWTRVLSVCSMCGVAIGTLGAPRPAGAHVAPSTDTNNRYLKVELRAREVRVAFTIYFGELPGARQRRLLDRDRDGTISDAEGRVFGESLRSQVASSIAVDLDGARQDGWTLVEVGLGSPAVTGGAFSVDLELRRAIADGAEHALRIEDRLELPEPGEAHLRVEPAPGVTMLAAHAEAGGGIRLEETATARALPPSTIRWRAPTAAATATPGSPTRSSWGHWPYALAIIAALGLVVGSAAYLKMKG